MCVEFIKSEEKKNAFLKESKYIITGEKLCEHMICVNQLDAIT